MKSTEIVEKEQGKKKTEQKSTEGTEKTNAQW